MEELKSCEFRDEKSKKKIYAQPQLEEIGKMKIITKGNKDLTSTTDVESGTVADGEWIN